MPRDDHRERLIARAATRVFCDGGRIPLDLHFEMLGEGLDAQAIEHQLQDDLEIT
jgi:hypothetical protein